MGIDLSALDCVALSHGHEDHTWGLEPLVRPLRRAGVGEAALPTPGARGAPQGLRQRERSRLRRGRPPAVRGQARPALPAEGEPRAPVAGPRPRLPHGHSPGATASRGRLAFGRKEGETGPDTVPEDARPGLRLAPGPGGDGGLLPRGGVQHHRVRPGGLRRAARGRRHRRLPPAAARAGAPGGHPRLLPRAAAPGPPRLPTAPTSSPRSPWPPWPRCRRWVRGWCWEYA